jgi:hypothetical protein
VLTLTSPDIRDIEATVSHDGYRTETIVIKGEATEPTTINLLTSRRAVFVTRESGRYDVYSSDADGQHRKIILPGTGNENANIALAVSPAGDRVAVVSTRDNQRNADGFLLTTLTLVDLADNSTMTLAHAEQIQLVDWIGTRLIFEQVGADSSSARYNVIGYDYVNSSRVQLASGKRLNAVLSAHGVIYYAVAADSADPSVQEGVYRISPDASNKQLVLDKEAWTTYRINYTTLNVQTPEGWYSISLSNGSTASIAGPSAYNSRLYDDNDDNSQSLWVDTANGNLAVYSVADAKDTTARSQSGLMYPVRWLTDTTAIYRIVTGGETADYAVSVLGGGQPVKIADVVNTYGFTQGQ